MKTKRYTRRWPEKRVNQVLDLVRMGTPEENAVSLVGGSYYHFHLLIVRDEYLLDTFLQAEMEGHLRRSGALPVYPRTVDLRIGAGWLRPGW